MKLRIGVFFLGLAFLFLSSGIAHGQGVVGEILGTVTDPSGAVIPDAHVLVRNTATNETRTVATTGSGSYVITSLIPGTYRLEASKTGFTAQIIDNVTVEVKQSREVNLVLKLGEVSQAVTVTAEAVVIDTENASQGSVITSDSVGTLPLNNGGNYVALTGLSAGAVPITGQVGQGSGVISQTGGRLNTSVSIGGNREQDMTYTYDGVESKSYWIGAVALYPPPDAIAEFKTQQGYLSPEFGPPVVVNVIMKSGQDSFHGSVFEFLRNDKLNAKGYFDAVRPPVKQNQFGVTAGDRFPGTKKHHWFAYYQGYRVRNGTTLLGTVPSSQELQGNFTDLVPLQNGGGCPYDPQNLSKNCLPNTTSQIIDPLTGHGFATPNVIPSNRINSLANALLPFFSPPNKPMDVLGNYRVVKSGSQNDDQFGIRTDHTLSDRDTLHISFAYSNSAVATVGLFNVSAAASPMDVRNLSLGWTHIFRPNLLNEFRMGYDDLKLLGVTPTGQYNPATLGFQNVSDIAGCVSYPRIGISHSSGLPTNSGNCFGGQDKDFLFYDNLSWVRDSHSFNFGADIRRVSHFVEDQLNLDGSISFNNAFSLSSTADFLLGAPSKGSFAVGSSAATNLGWWMSYYVNDDWRVTKRLTLNLGVRYTNNSPLAPKEHNYSVFDFSTGTLLHPPQDGLPPGVANRTNTDFAPRVGLAYKVTEKTVVRSSYGIYFVDDPADDLSFNALNPPTYAQIAQFATTPGTLTYTVKQGLPSDLLFSPSIASSLPPNGSLNSPIGLYTRTRNRPAPYIQQWNLSVQRALPWNMLFDISYIGNEGTHLSKRVDMNTAVPLTGPPCAPNPITGCDPRTIQQRRPYPNWTSILESSNIATSNYNALQTSLQKSFSNGLNFSFAYTWSKAISEDDYDSLGARNYSWLLLSADRARATYDRRHRVSSSVIYALPFGNAPGDRMRALINNWRVSIVDSFTTGAPFGVTTSTDYAQIGNSFGFARPDRICNGNLPNGQRTITRWFDTSCFVAPVNPFPHLGNAGYNFLDAPGTIQVDVSIQKTFKISEKLDVQFRSDLFNAFNITNFKEPGNNIDQTSFGVISSALPPRQIQLGLHVSW